MAINIDSRPISEWMLERLTSGDLPEHHAETLRRKLAQEEGGLARLEAIRASNETILGEYPAEKMIAEFRRRARR